MKNAQKNPKAEALGLRLIQWVILEFRRNVMRV